MTLPRGRIAKPIVINAVRSLTAEDTTLLAEPRAAPSRIKKLRHSHHRVADLLGRGLRLDEVAQITGYSYARVASLSIDPTVQELAAKRREATLARHETLQDEYTRLKFNNMVAAERHIADTIAELDDECELLPIKTALAVSADGADRLGYGKHSTQTNINYEFAERLDRAIKRSGKMIDVTPGAAPSGAGTSTTAQPLRRRI